MIKRSLTWTVALLVQVLINNSLAGGDHAQSPAQKMGQPAPNAASESALDTNLQEVHDICRAELSGQYNQRSDMILRGSLFLVAVVSILSLVTITHTIQTTPKLQQHPATLIWAICLSEAALTWNAFFQMRRMTAAYFMCYFKSFAFLRWSLFGSVSLKRAFVVQGFSQAMVFEYLQFVALLLNMCFCRDLVQTLQNPFEVARLRTWKYLAFSTLTPIGLTAVIWGAARQQYPSFFYETTKGALYFKEEYRQSVLAAQKKFLDLDDLYNLALAICLSIFMLMGFYSIIFSCRRLGRPGVSKEMRKLFIKKHALYVIALIAIWLVQLLFNYYELFKPR